VTQVDPAACAVHPVTPEAIEATEPLIRPYIRRTPVVTVDRADFGLPPGPLVLKLEQLQHSGSFKARGAFANLLLRDLPPGGVTAPSGGNHGAAVAYAAGVRGVPARIFVPTTSSPAKTARIRGYRADLVVTGEHYNDALAAAQAWADTSGALLIPAFDQVETMLGAGTLAVELAGQAPDVESVLVGVGGGGLLGGMAGWYAGRTTLIAAEPVDAPTLTRARAAGRPVDSPTGSIATDSLAPRQIGQLNFPLLARHVTDVVLVTDDEIRRAQQALWHTVRVVAEPGGSAAMAALLSGRYVPPPGAPIAVVVSGANTTAVDFSRC
jgi:threonine dehydratase